jgi:hypothetical protein
MACKVLVGFRARKKRSKVQQRKQRKANERVRVAIRRGKLLKGICVVCGITDVEAHHEDYGRPLDVVWLCKSHHEWMHGVVRKFNTIYGG